MKKKLVKHIWWAIVQLYFLPFTLIQQRKHIKDHFYGEDCFHYLIFTPDHFSRLCVVRPSERFRAYTTQVHTYRDVHRMQEQADPHTRANEYITDRKRTGCSLVRTIELLGFIGIWLIHRGGIERSICIGPASFVPLHRLLMLLTITGKGVGCANNCSTAAF